MILMVGAEGFEPPTLCSQSRCATRLRYAPTFLIVSQANGIFLACRGMLLPRSRSPEQLIVHRSTYNRRSEPRPAGPID
jgi:hypothetical protein